ncbi:ABC1 domain containing protein [Naviculisporaceae sp. PSN 640]
MRFADILLDLAAMASASRSVASKHVALRAGQLDRYGKTSTIISAATAEAKARRSQAGANETDQQRQDAKATEAASKESEVEISKKESEVHEQTILQSKPVGEPTVASETPAVAPRKEALQTSSEVERKLQDSTSTIPKPSSSSPGTSEQKPKFTPAPWASGTPLPTAFPPPKRPLVSLKSDAGTLEDSMYRIGKKGLKIMEALEEAAIEARKAEEEQRAKETAGVSDADVKKPLTVEDIIEMPTRSIAQVDGVEDSSAATRPAAEKIDENIITTQKAPSISQEDANIVADLTSGGTPASPHKYELRESRVPSTRIGRLWNYGGLAAGMFAGAIGEGLSRAVGGGSQGSMMLSPANMERLVAKLSRMRGAALKLGQMMSFQDAKMLPPAIQEVLQRVQDRADYMPAWQRDRVLKANLGPEWRELFDEFEEKPIAAASIGQVHRATLKSNGARVAVKIQFPGVADSINSDLDNIAVLLAATKLLPKGLYLNKTIDNARTELGWECDYEREAQCGQRYRQLLTDPATGEFNDVFEVPRIYPEASGKQVITMEFMDGVGVTRMMSELSQSQRDWIGTQILRLCLREITEFKFMQTDPNWTNFLFNPATEKLELLDFGASREYPDEFIEKYIRLLEASSRADRETIKSLSEELGYLTGHESKAMLDAHIISVTTLAEPFLKSAPEVYDFRDQTITERVKAQIPVMIHERLAPPPEETYSLHRKLSGAFLLCARLGSRVRCRELFEDALKKTGMTFP